jgi:uncharacterized membrane protein
VYTFYIIALLVLFCMVTLCVLLCAKKLLGQFGVVIGMSAFVLMNAIMIQVALGVITHSPSSASYASFMLWVVLGVELVHGLLLLYAAFQGRPVTTIHAQEVDLVHVGAVVT